MKIEISYIEVIVNDCVHNLKPKEFHELRRVLNSFVEDEYYAYANPDLLKPEPPKESEK